MLNNVITLNKIVVGQEVILDGERWIIDTQTIKQLLQYDPSTPNYKPKRMTIDLYSLPKNESLQQNS